jgi:hypothetical protein
MMSAGDDATADCAENPESMLAAKARLSRAVERMADVAEDYRTDLEQTQRDVRRVLERLDRGPEG